MSAAPRETVTLAQLQSIENVDGWCPACEARLERHERHDAKCWLAAAILALRETPPAVPQDGIRHDPDSGSYVARHTILTAGTTYEEAARALASAVSLTAKHWPKLPLSPPAVPSTEARGCELCDSAGRCTYMCEASPCR